MWTTVAYFVCAYPVYMLMGLPGFVPVITAQLLLSVILAFYIGPAPTVFVELFPTSVRFTGMALSYNICAGLFGGTAPYVATWLIKETGMNTVVALYIMLAAVVSFVSFIGYHDLYKEELH
jgi:MHS family proline/betaine transporter-like MFS transporter